MRMSRWVIAAAVCLLATPALAGSLRCTDAKGGNGGGICRAFREAPKASSSDPHVAAAIKVWEKVSRRFEAMTGRQTGLSVSAPEATFRGKPFPPGAFICPGAPPIVNIPYTLLDRVYVKKEYPEDFLAFVFGHELGHRMNDLTVDGCQLAAFQRPGKGQHEEELADSRGAFFAAAAGFSTRTIAKEDLVSQFLAAEYQVEREIRDERKGALVKALHYFDAYESLYDVAISLALSKKRDVGQRLLAWADELIEAHGIPIPEVKVARAIGLVMQAAGDAPALAGANKQPDIASLRCKPIFPEHTGLWERPKVRRTRAAGKNSVAMLRKARRLLQRAEELGANELVVSSTKACVSAYLGEMADARRELANAERELPRRAPAAVKAALEHNRNLVGFLEWFAANPLPPKTETAAAKKWATSLKRAKKSFEGAPGIQVVTRRMTAWPELSRAPKRARKAAEPVFELTKPPGMSGMPTGKCPTGYRLLHSLPGAQAAGGIGVTTCTPTGRRGERLVGIRLPASMSPALPEVDLTVQVLDRLPSAAQTLDAWSKTCTRLRERGVSERGLSARLASCRKAGVSSGLVYVDRKGRVRRLVRTIR